MYGTTFTPDAARAASSLTAILLLHTLVLRFFPSTHTLIFCAHSFHRIPFFLALRICTFKFTHYACICIICTFKYKVYIHIYSCMKHICTHTCRQTLSPVSRSNTLAPVPCVRPPAPCFPPPPAPAVVSNHWCVRHPLCRLASHSTHPEPPHRPRRFPPNPAPAWLATTLKNRNRINVKVCNRSHSPLITPSSGDSIRTIVATSNPP